MPGSPWIWVFLHINFTIAFTLYSIYNLWIVYKDQTTIEIINLYSSNKYVPKFTRRSLRLNMILIFGASNIFKALFYPLLNVLPMNGLEYEFENLNHRVPNLCDSNDLWSKN